METAIRKPFQGVKNIIRFNWHFYLIAGGIIALLFIISRIADGRFALITTAAIVAILATTSISLAVSFYIYDYSAIYDLKWLTSLKIKSGSRIINVNAGFDETSITIKTKYPYVSLTIFDFYDPEKHTEISIERARKAYPAHPNTVRIETTNIPLKPNSGDFVFNIFSMHEIRDRNERVLFLKKQYEILTEDGKCVIVEHLRDLPNFLAYTIGFFHFHSKREWHRNFSEAGFKLERTEKITPFVSVFILTKNYGTTS
jgi:ubiquinone/menaquinone biosynthesis C-methylase UbiE